MSDKHHRYYKHTKFCQNPRGDPKFLVDLTRNDPYIKQNQIAQSKMAAKEWLYSVFALLTLLNISIA